MSDSAFTLQTTNNDIRVLDNVALTTSLQLPDVHKSSEINAVNSHSVVITADDQERHHSYTLGMPATTSSSVNHIQVPRMQDFSLLPYQMASYPAHQGLFLYSGNGFDVLRGPPPPPPPLPPPPQQQSQSAFVKEESRPFENKELQDGTTARNASRPPNKESVISDPYVVSLKQEVVSPPSPRKDATRQSDKISAETVSNHAVTGAVSSIIRTSNFSVSEKSRQHHHHHHHQQQQHHHPPHHHHHQHHAHVLRYPTTNCSTDALLSASAVVGYVDSDIMQENAAAFNGLDDSLLSSRGTGDGSSDAPLPSAYDLFESNTHDSYAGNTELRLSPHVFSDGSNLSGVTNDPITDNVLGNGSDADSGNRSQDANKLSVPQSSLLDKSKTSKSRPGKATSPSRTGAQTCPVCGKVFSNSSALAKHKLTHSDERKYVCQLCTKAFKRQDHLNGHLLTHMNKKPYECKVDGCGKSYCDARSLRRHSENHHSSSSNPAAPRIPQQQQQQQQQPPPPPNQPPVSLSSATSFGVIEPAKLTMNGTTLTNSSISRLANALQSNRICYAPPPPPPPTQVPAVQMATVMSSVLQSALSAAPLNFRRSPSPATTVATVATTTSAVGAATTTTSSAANQLQLLAFQQQEQRTGPQPGTSLLSWQLQQPPRTAGGVGGGNAGNIQIATMLDEYLGQTEMSAATTSVLAQHLRMALPQVRQLDALPPSRELAQQQLHDNQWATTATVGRDDADQTGVVVKQVECSICQRKFKNTPALNGHMRLHGGYFRKESVDVNNGRKTATNDRMKTSDGQSSTSSSMTVTATPSHPPLQTASMNVRALIEEKIIQRRIVNPVMNSSSIPTPPPSLSSIDLRHMDLLNYDSEAALRNLQQEQEQQQQQQQQQEEQHHRLRAQECQELNLEIEMQQHHHHPHHHHQEEQQQQPLEDTARTSHQSHSLLRQQEEYVREPDPPLPPPPPPPPLPLPPSIHQVQNDDGGGVVYSDDPMLMANSHADSVLSTESVDSDYAQSDMQRQIEIIKQGLMAHQHVAEKFRRHSDSDHFLAPRRTPFGPGYTDPDFFSVGALAEFFHREKLVGKRTQRTGSDPGEFGVSEMPDDDCGGVDGLLPDDVVDAMDVADSAVGLEELPDALQVGETLPAADMMDFEVDSENLASTLETSLLTSALDSGTSSSVVFTNYRPPPPDHMPNVIASDVTFGSSVSTLKVKMDEDDDVFLSPSSIPTSPIRPLKKKHRPEPLFIPPQVNTCGFQSRLRSPRLWDPSPSIGGGGGMGGLASGAGGGGCGGIGGGSTGVGFSTKPSCSPPPYTPPPMLSPLRCGSGLFWHVLSASGSMTPKSTPLTPSRQGLAALGGFPSGESLQASPLEAEEEIDEAPETDILPHVNVGPQFQARLPLCRSYAERIYEPHVDDLVWDPACVEDSISDKEVENYLRFACCAAVPGGGRNKEYAFHVLKMAAGNVQEAMLRLMDPVPKLDRDHPLIDYPYAECDKWSAEDIDSYQQALMNFDKDFFNISLELKTKSVKQCIQFYYLWKKVCPDEYRRLRTLRRRREQQDGLPCSLRGAKADVGGLDCDDHDQCQADSSPGKPGGDSVGGERYACDYPDCFASFVSKQALNGHVRIHGRNANVTNGGGSGVANRGRSRSPTKFSAADTLEVFGGETTNVVSAVAVSAEEFPCKICGKVFSKVKSRSAHMKSHRPIDPDRVK